MDFTISTDAQLEGLGQLFEEVTESMKNGRRGFKPSYHFADILFFLGLLTLPNLVKVIGEDNAQRIWPEVKPEPGGSYDD
jgi:hypothetical protein